MPTYSLISIGVMVAVFALVTLFNHLRGGSSTLVALGGPQGSQVIKAARKGNLNPYVELMRTTDQDTRVFLADAVGKSGKTDMIAAWLANDPTNADAHLTWGTKLIGQAWDARGGGSKVTKKGQRLFAERLVQADAAFQHAAAARPDDAAPWAFRLVCARGLGADRSVADHLFAEATRRDPECWHAHFEMLRFLTRKWGGSDEAMYGFARGVSARAPVGSDLHALVFVAHVERWIDLLHLQGKSKVAADYAANPAVALECRTAYDKSLGSPSLRSRLSTQLARNYAAAMFFLIKDKDRVRAEIMQLGNAHAASPWNCFGSTPEAGYRRAAKFAF